MARDIRGDDVVITFDGSAQRVSDSLPRDVALRMISFQAGTANINPFFRGMKPTLTTSLYGLRVPAPVAGEPYAPLIYGEFRDGSMWASNFFVLGTMGEKVHVEILAYE